MGRIVSEYILACLAGKRSKNGKYTVFIDKEEIFAVVGHMKFTEAEMRVLTYLGFKVMYFVDLINTIKPK